MANIRQLYQLQELDMETEQLQGSLRQVEQSLADRSTLDTLGEGKELQHAVIRRLQIDQKNHELDANETRQKLNQVEKRLYGGTVHVLSELEAIQKEADILKNQVEEREEHVLESMLTLEYEEKHFRVLEQDYSKSEAKWSEIQEQLNKEKDRLLKELDFLKIRRQEFVDKIEETDLDVYETLRTTKSGQAVTLVNRGLCGTCRVSLPTHQLQRSRSGRERVPCNSCGRLLFFN